MSDSSSLVGKTVSGMMWRFAERMMAQGVSFVVSMVLARLLMPEDYGAIALVTVFITLANIFITDGFSAALIQKKDSDALDYSSVLFGGGIISIVIYIIIFFCAPFVSAFYNMPVLTPVLRFLAIRIPLASINSVENAYLSKNLEFKKFFWATFAGTAGSAVVGLIAAYNGCGVWALVYQNLFNYTVDTIVLAIVIRKKPILKFSLSRAKVLFKYGYKILLTNLMFTLSDQLRTVIIGKFYSAAQLAFYSKGKYFPNLVSTNVTSPLSTVLFPVMSKMQDDINMVRETMRKSMRIISFVMCPLLLGLAAVSKPMVELLLTEKWLPSVPFVWIGCIYYIFPPLHSVNLEAVKSVGRSDLVLKYGFYKRIVGFITLLVAIPFGVMAIALSTIASALIASAINARQNKQLFDYKYRKQIADVFPNIINAVIMCMAVYIIGNIINLHLLLELCVQVSAGIIVYIILALITGNSNLKYCINIIEEKIKTRR